MKANAHPGERISGTGPEVLYRFLSRIRPSDGNLELPDEFSDEAKLPSED
jgi:hypothetical protein